MVQSGLNQDAPAELRDLLIQEVCSKVPADERQSANSTIPEERADKGNFYNVRFEALK